MKPPRQIAEEIALWVHNVNPSTIARLKEQIEYAFTQDRTEMQKEIDKLASKIEHLNKMKMTGLIETTKPIEIQMKEMCKKHMPVQFFACGQCAQERFETVKMLREALLEIKNYGFNRQSEIAEQALNDTKEFE